MRSTGVIPALLGVWITLGAVPGLSACSTTEAMPVAPERTGGWEAGRQYRYDLHMESRASGPANGAEPMFAFDLRGRLMVAVQEVAPGRQVLAFRMVEPKFGSVPSEEARVRFASAERDLSRTSTFTFEAGRVTASRLPKDGSALSVGILRNVAAAFQNAPRPEGKSSWTAEEYDATGRYVVEYQRTASDHVTRKKLRYAALIVNEKLRTELFKVKDAMPAFNASAGELWTIGGVPSKVRSTEELAADLANGPPLKTNTLFSLDLQTSERAPPLDRAAIEASTTPLSADAPYVHASGDLDLDSSKIGGLTLEQMVSGLEAIAKDGKDVKLTEKLNDEEASQGDVAAGKSWMAERNRLFVALAALFRKEPDSILRAVTIVRSKSPASDTIVSALGAAGTEAGQRALLSLMEDRKRPDKLRKAAGLSLVRTKVPTVFAARELERLLSDPFWKEYATYGLGTYARRLGETGHPEELERIGGLLVGLMRAAPDRGARLDALAGISNSGYPGALPLVEPLLTNEDPIIRGAAVQAIRLMKHAAVDDLIVQRLETDDSPEVRVAAVQAARNRTPEKRLGDALGKRTLTDESSRVRMQALKVVVQWQRDVPSLKAVLDEVVRRESEATIREVAASASSGN